MPTQYDMTADSELYRAILEFDYQPMKQIPNPNYDARADHRHPNYRSHEMWRPNISVPDGAPGVGEKIVGPYQSITPIKAYVTRNRNNVNNLRIKTIERASAWEEVDY